MKKAASPSCPRCGYDLSGVVESWKEACPLNGVCSECGLEFRWRELFRADELRVRGFYEHATGVALASAWRTWAWTLLPWMFWKKVRLEHPVRLRRMLLWLVVLLLPIQLFHGAHVVVARRAATIAGPAGGPVSVPFFGDDPTGLVAQAMEPLLAFDENTVYQRLIAWSRMKSAGTATPGLYLERLFTGVLPGWRAWPEFGLPLVAVMIAMAGMILILPQTRARARVRLVHVARAAVYGLSWLVVPAALRVGMELEAWIDRLFLSGGSSMVLWNTGQRLTGMLTYGGYCERLLSNGTVMWLTGVAWLAAWWLCTIRQGFRIREWLVVWLAVLVPSVLVGIIAFSVTSDNFALFVDRIARGRLRLW